MGQENSNPRRRRLVGAVVVAAALAAVPAGAALAESGGGGAGGGTEGQATFGDVQQSQPRDGDRDGRDCPEDRQRAQPEGVQL
jgi:phage tail tape-measure protein